MGFPFDTADWSVVEGAMYMGANGGAPALYTWLSVAVMVGALWLGNRMEHKLYDDYK